MRPAAAESAFPDNRGIRLPIPEDDSPYCLQVSALHKTRGVTPFSSHPDHWQISAYTDISYASGHFPPLRREVPFYWAQTDNILWIK
ncbi:hypothetical protein R70723_02115 [Paenibacillus sp. FSL R7-0273]|nr:hypothetical protein R70723_02115 [Paenibacillus sp. FSL R7-0273]OMF93309.1 hypothetical protein BK144_11400 [Paenibacillus sp. FSL R7-0273]